MTAKRVSPWRIAIVAALALGLAFMVVRSALEAAWVDQSPEQAARAWPGHPRVELALSMAEIGRLAAAGRRPSPQAIARSMRGAAGAPLAVEPFLIAGAVATAEGQTARAEQLLEEARARDPRSPAARFFLAQHYLETGRISEGLGETSVLSRLVPGAMTALVPGLAQYARAPGAAARLKTMVAANPALGQQLLTELARDADNADLIVALAPHHETAAPQAWHDPLLHALVERGDYPRALALWRRVGGVTGPKPALFNPAFAPLKAPAPFNWTLSSGDFGVAEPSAPAGLQIIYFGRANAELASQLLLLAPGDYALAMEVRRDGGGEGASGLAWALDCVGGGKRLLLLPLGAGPVSGRFTVPGGCAAQRLVLTGTPRETAAMEQVTLSGLRLTKVMR